MHISGIVTNVVITQVNGAGRPGAAQQTVRAEAVHHFGEQSEDIDAHDETLPIRPRVLHATPQEG